MYKCMFQSVSVGVETVRNVLVNLTSAAATTEISEVIEENLGTGTLGNFHLITDYADNVLYVSPEESSSIGKW